MPIAYNSKLIIPAPFVTVEKTYDKSGDKHVGSIYTITLTGKILPCNGSPSTTGWHTDVNTSPASEPDFGADDKRLRALIAKKELMRTLFADEGKKLDIIPVDNGVGTHCYPRVNTLGFPAGEDISWYNYMNYTIVLEADTMIGPSSTYDLETSDIQNTGSGESHEHYSKLSPTGVNDEHYLRDVSETWNLEFNDNPEGIMPKHAFRLTHTLSATGKRHYDSNGLVREAWENAKRWAGERLGLDTEFVNLTQGLSLPSYYQGYNHARAENTDEQNGTYEVTETWIISSGNVAEDFTVAQRSSVENSKDTITIEGRINGLETRDSSYFNVTEDKFTAANNYFANLVTDDELFARCELYSGFQDLNAIPFDYSIQRNPVGGYVAYNYTYDNRATVCVSGALSASIDVSDNNLEKTVNVFASIPILGRDAGPILQDMGTTTDRRRTVSVEVLMPAGTGCPTTVAGINTLMASSPRTQVDVIIGAFNSHVTDATGLDADQSFREQDAESWNPHTGRYTRNVTWVWQKCQ